jgi:hypothetical protein
LSDDKNFLQSLANGLHEFDISIDKFLLYPGEYQLNFAVLINDEVNYYEGEGLIFNIIENNLFYSSKINARKGLIFTRELLKLS